jgi:hypothetical protein
MELSSSTCAREAANGRRPGGNVVNASLLDQDLGLSETEEDFTVKKFVSGFGVEAFVSVYSPRIKPSMWKVTTHQNS